MTGTQYAILAYVAAFLVLGGYGAHLWLMSRSLSRRGRGPSSR